MKKLIVLIMAVAFILIATSAFAATATQGLLVSANVIAACRIESVTNVTFTDYDPTDPNPNDTGTGDFTFRCTRGTNYDLYIAGVPREMTGGAFLLSYELYQDAGRSSAWPSGLPGVAGSSLNSAPVTRNIYGRIPADQDVGVGAYSQTVQITVEY